MLSAEHLLVFCAGLAAGAINSIAGGGTLVTFPTLVWLGRDPIVANATNALALWPGSLAGAYALRREATQLRGVVLGLLPVSVLGAWLGGFLLLATPARVFSALVPWLVLAATLLLAVRAPLARLTTRGTSSTALTTPGAWLLGSQLLVCIYGGYFGAGMGILMLASLALCGIEDIHQRNGVKNALSTVINGTAGAYFVWSGAIAWLDAAVLAVSAVLGGYGAASLSRRVPKAWVERAVLGIGAAATVALMLRR
jgi:uncharacterized protein